MKIRTLLLIFTTTFSALVFSACSDESEEIIPQPVNLEDVAATVGDGTKDDDVD